MQPNLSLMRNKSQSKSHNKSYSKINLFIRSLIMSIILIVSCPIECIFCLLAAPLPLRVRYKVTMAWVKAMLKMLEIVCHIYHEVEGWENVKKVKTAIVLSKHQSTWETFFLVTQFPEIAIIVKKELLWFPFFGWGLALLKPIAINRKEKKSAMSQIVEQGKKDLDNGRWILIFPEGTRIPYGQVGNYRIGGARLAVATGYPVIPVAHNAGKYWPRRGFIKYPGTVKVVFGPPIQTQGQTPEAVIDQTKNWIEGVIEKLDKT